jgi:formylglycine-generating enzyme required for sulfatase activity
MEQLTSSQLSPRGLGVLLAAFGLAVPASAQVTPYGSGINPAGSLELTAGSPQIGATMRLTVRNTALSNPLPGQAFLCLATQPWPGLPVGLQLPGLGLAFPGAPGELLIDLTPPNPFATLGPVPYAGGTSSGAHFDINVAFNPASIGLEFYSQGLLLTPAQDFPLGLTNAVRFPIAPAQFPGFALIQPGTFLMGSNAAGGAPYFGSSAEQPVHAVTITKPFWMGTTEVTQAQYQALIGGNPSSFVGPNNPVERVSWLSAQFYCAALTAQQTALGKVPAGYQYRLPTEAEWEYACRAGTTTEFNVGSGLLCNQAKFLFSYHSSGPGGCPPIGTVPVGQYPANAWGLHDMHGNVGEWCLDSFANYPAGAVTDPFATGGSNRVFRGGTFFAFSSSCRSASRGTSTPSSALDIIGFRVVLAPVLVP